MQAKFRSQRENGPSSSFKDLPCRFLRERAPHEARRERHVDYLERSGLAWRESPSLTWSFFLLILAMLTALIADRADAQTPPSTDSEQACHLLTTSDPVPSGLGAPYNPLSSQQELLLKATCTDTQATLEVGNGSNVQYVYEQGYEWRNESWNPITYQGAQKTGFWLIGTGTATVSRTASEMAEDNLFVAYVCTWTGVEWKCGCRDSSCATPYWQLQAFQRQGAGGGGMGDFQFIFGYTKSNVFSGVNTTRTFYYPSSWGMDSGDVSAKHSQGDLMLDVFGVNNDKYMSGTESVQQLANKIIAHIDKTGADGVLFDEFSLRTVGSPNNVDKFNLVLDALPAVKQARPGKLFAPFLTGSTGQWATSNNAKPLRDALESGLIPFALQEVYANCDGVTLEHYKKTVDRWANEKPDLIPKLIPTYGLGSNRSGCPYWSASELDSRMQYLLDKWLPHANPPPGLGFWWGSTGGISQRNSAYTDVINKHYGPYF